MIGIILASVLVTSLLSGVLGMGGGMILMGVFTLLLPVTQAMMLHGVAQLSANGSRAILHFRHIAWRTLPPYVAGTLLSLGAFSMVAMVSEKWVIYLLLGAFPFLALKVKAISALSIERPLHSFLCGAVVTALQLLAGVSGPVLDVFYLKTKMTRHEIIATKALTQSLGHTVKLFYYGALATSSAASTLPEWVMPASAAVALLGTILGGRLLESMSDATFQKISRAVILGLGAVYLVQGVLNAPL